MNHNLIDNWYARLDVSNHVQFCILYVTFIALFAMFLSGFGVFLVSKRVVLVIFWPKNYIKVTQLNLLSVCKVDKIPSLGGV